MDTQPESFDAEQRDTLDETGGETFDDFGGFEAADLPDVAVADDSVTLEAKPTLWANWSLNAEINKPEANVDAPLPSTEESVLDSVPATTSQGQEDRIVSSVEDVAELKKLQQCNDELEKQIKELQGQIAKQEAQYNELQSKHQAEIEVIRQDGHKALATALEEYKELARLAVAEQRKVDTEELKKILQEELDCHKTLIVEERVRLRELLDKEREDAWQHVKEKATTLLTTNEERVSQLLADNKQKEEDSRQEALQRLSAEQDKRLSEQLSDMKDRNEKFVLDQQERVIAQMQQEKKNLSDAITEALEAEKSHCKKVIADAASEEHQRTTDFLQQALISAHTQVADYIQHQRNADEAVRRRAAMSMDLFLEMARKQLDLLLNPTFLASEPVPVPRNILPPPPPSAPSSSSEANDSANVVKPDHTSGELAAKHSVQHVDSDSSAAGALVD